MELDDQRWHDIVERTPDADGRFFYAVTTTGVYCRPTCPSRRPRRDNVQLFDSGAAAEVAGFRPCKRCKPSLPSADHDRASLVAEACRLIEASDEPPDLEGLAAAVGMSPFHFHRVFKAATGLTPKAYGDAHRGERVRRNLEERSSVTDAIYDAGFGSSASFYAGAGRRMGMAPARYRDGGRDETIRFAVAASSLGPILVAGTDAGICTVQFGDDPEALVHALQDRFPHAELVGDDADFASVVADVVALVEHPEAGLDLPLDIRGTAFQERVWRALQDIPAGTTATYGEIAEAIGAPGSARAVGAACGANVIAVAIPCHRVVRTDGSLSGYRWGIDRKRTLLTREGAVIAEPSSVG